MTMNDPVYETIAETRSTGDRSLHWTVDPAKRYRTP
jgi:hypothetical protein